MLMKFTNQALWLKFWVSQSTGSGDNPGYWIGVYLGFGMLNIAAIAMETR